METALTYLNVMPETQSEIKMFSDQILSDLQIREALPLLAKVTALEKLAKTIKDGIKEQMLEEASLYSGEKTFEINGVKYTRTERKTYHYNHCDKWKQLNADLEALEKMMQTGKEFADPETGEIIQPANVSYSESINVTLKK